MSAAHRGWDVLGIAPTGDQRAIRLAYSARLKSIDPEADPQAFIELRDAFEYARGAAANAPQEAAYAPIQTGPAWEAAPEEAFPASEAEADPIADRANAIAELLYNHDPGADFLDPAAVEQLLTLWHAIATDSRLDDVTLFDRVEQWAGSIILDTAPRSVPLIVPVADFLRWPEREGTLAETPGLARLIQCYHAIRFVDAAQELGHSHHGEWIELSTPAPPGTKRGTVGPRKLFELLNLIRWIRPDIAAQLDPERIAIWDRKAEFEAGESEPELGRYGGGAIAGGGIGLIWLVVALMRSCSDQQGDPPPPPPSSFEIPAEPMQLPPAGQHQQELPPGIRLDPLPSPAASPQSGPERPTPQ